MNCRYPDLAPLTAYNRGCRCEERCKPAAADYRRDHRISQGLYKEIECAYCGHEIVYCEGKHGDWMHERTHREHCAGDRTLAEPRRVRETVT